MADFIASGNRGLFYEFVQNLDVAAFEASLVRVGKVAQREVFESIVKASVANIARDPGGRQRFHPLFMLMVLVLQHLHGLAGNTTSFQVTDHKSFHAFRRRRDRVCRQRLRKRRY